MSRHIHTYKKKKVKVKGREAAGMKERHQQEQRSAGENEAGRGLEPVEL